MYINKRIDPDTGEVEHPSKDLTVLKLRIWNGLEGLGEATRTVWIHNVYNPCPGTYTT